MQAQELISSILGREGPPLEPQMRFHEIDGWDSLVMVSLVVKLEEELGRELSEGELDGLRTLADVESLLKES